MAPPAPLSPLPRAKRVRAPHCPLAGRGPGPTAGTRVTWRHKCVRLRTHRRLGESPPPLGHAPARHPTQARPQAGLSGERARRALPLSPQARRGSACPRRMPGVRGGRTLRRHPGAASARQRARGGRPGPRSLGRNGTISWCICDRVSDFVDFHEAGVELLSWPLRDTGLVHGDFGG